MHTKENGTHTGKLRANDEMKMAAKGNSMGKSQEKLQNGSSFESVASTSVRDIIDPINYRFDYGKRFYRFACGKIHLWLYIVGLRRGPWLLRLASRVATMRNANLRPFSHQREYSGERPSRTKTSMKNVKMSHRKVGVAVACTEICIWNGVVRASAWHRRESEYE